MGNTLRAQSIEVNACLSQQLDALGDDALALQVELQVELPGGGSDGQSSHGVCQREPNLDEFGAFHIVPSVLVVELGRRVEGG